MRRSIRPLVVVALAVTALALGGCVLAPDLVDPPPCSAVAAHPMPACEPPPTPCSAVAVHPLPACSQPFTLEITSVVVSQQQAVPDFDGTRLLVEDAAELDRLEAILNPSHPVASGCGCDGGRTTVLEISPAVGDPFVLTTDTCTDDATADEIDALASEWRESDAFPVAP